MTEKTTTIDPKDLIDTVSEDEQKFLQLSEVEQQEIQAKFHQQVDVQLESLER